MYKVSSIEYMSDEHLATLAADPECSNAAECRDLLAKRKGLGVYQTEAERLRRESVRADLQVNPFDPRNEVSADAHHIAGQIVKHLWIFLVVLPFVLAVLYAILRAL